MNESSAGRFQGLLLPPAVLPARPQAPTSGPDLRRPGSHLSTSGCCWEEAWALWVQQGVGDLEDRFLAEPSLWWFWWLPLKGSKLISLGLWVSSS